MFGRKSRPSTSAGVTSKSNYENFRKHERFSPRNLSAYVDGTHCQVLDYSDGGVRLTLVKGLRRTALIEIYKGDRLIKKTPAVIAWERNGEIGYAFRENLQIYEIDVPTHRPSEEGRAEPDPNHNDAGGVSGSALRKRLNLK